MTMIHLHVKVTEVVWLALMYALADCPTQHAFGMYVMHHVQFICTVRTIGTMLARSNHLKHDKLYLPIGCCALVTSD